MSNLIALNDREARTKALANTMFEMLAEGRDVTDVLLIGEGYSAYELETLGTAAKNLANQRFVRQVEREGFTRTDDEWVKLAADAAIGAIGDAQTTTAMLGAGIPPHVIDRLWERIHRRVGVRIGMLKPHAHAAANVGAAG